MPEKKIRTTVSLPEQLLSKYRRQRKSLGLNLSAITTKALEKAIQERKEMLARMDREAGATEKGE